MDFQVEDLKKIATFQRLMVIAVAAQLIITVVSFIIPFVGILGFVAGIFCLYTMIMVSQALKHDMPVTVIYAICAFIPVVSLVALYLLVTKATAALKAAGYNVGFFGMSKAEIENIK